MIINPKQHMQSHYAADRPANRRTEARQENAVGAVDMWQWLLLRDRTMQGCNQDFIKGGGWASRYLLRARPKAERVLLRIRENPEYERPAGRPAGRGHAFERLISLELKA